MQSASGQSASGQSNLLFELAQGYMIRSIKHSPFEFLTDINIGKCFIDCVNYIDMILDNAFRNIPLYCFSIFLIIIISFHLKSNAHQLNINNSKITLFVN